MYQYQESSIVPTTSRPTAMVLRELPSILGRIAGRNGRSAVMPCCRRYASTEAAAVQNISEDIQDLEAQSTFSSTLAPDEKIKSYDPIKRAQGRRRELPSSRYVGCTHGKTGQMLIFLADTNFDLQDTTEDLFIPISLLQNPILPHGNSSLVLSTIPVLNKPTKR